MTRAVERDVGLGIVGHQATEEGRQQLHSIVDKTRNDLLGVKDWCLLSQVDVASDLAERIEPVDVRQAVRVRESPQRRPEGDRAPLALANELVPADRHRSLRYMRQPKHPQKRRAQSSAYLNLEVFCSDPVQELLDLRIFGIDDGRHFQ
jgi:hypothetical protein